MTGIKKFIIQCEFGGKLAPFAIYIGEPRPDSHPVQHQNTWLSKERGGSVPEKVRNSLEKLHDLAKKNGICFADLCVYALSVAARNKDNSGGGAAT
ncbi:hypothetical protein ACIS_00818 [Anaplasma centrale str. Israel]|uniref:DUF2610 domain-containing protein n=1 Tax=Anaplasma centrale (strain Israel) TaxID=574556 RepID=D1ASA3_ANACI|nr:DUF2610 domain-containing protein [Anaplasma centrale]ACZ49356.1 hypothetical protein ACIS_00818 [Anaplasma centrale str. Israel]